MATKSTSYERTIELKLDQILLELQALKKAEAAEQSSTPTPMKVGKRFVVNPSMPGNYGEKSNEEYLKEQVQILQQLIHGVRQDLEDTNQVLVRIAVKDFIKAADQEVDYWHLPSMLYIKGSPSSGQITRADRAFERFLESLDLEVVQREEARTGSWFRRMVGRTKEIVKKQEVQDTLQKAVRGAELVYLDKPQAEADNLEVTALAQFAQGTTGIQNIAFRVGSIILIKTTDAENVSSMMIRSLNQSEMIFLANNPGIVNPEEMIAALGSLNRHPKQSLSLDK